MGAVPKKDGSIRIILDLSAPHGTSVNNGIPSEFFSVKYSSFDDAVSLVKSLGHGHSCFMAKIDIKMHFDCVLSIRTGLYLGLNGWVSISLCVLPCLRSATEKSRSSLRVFSSLGVPISEDKLEGPSQCLSFLRIEIDFLYSTIRLPSDKLSNLNSSIHLWSSRKKCRK